MLFSIQCEQRREALSKHPTNPMLQIPGLKLTKREGPALGSPSCQSFCRRCHTPHTAAEARQMKESKNKDTEADVRQ